MNPPIVAFFNNKGGVGRTSLLYHLAWMFAERGVSVLAADLDPQASLTTSFLEEGRLAELWAEKNEGDTVYEPIRPLLRGKGEMGPPHVEAVGDNLGLIVGDLALSTLEEELSRQWTLCLDGSVHAFRVVTVFWRICREAALARDARVVLVDLGPNLGAINRAALVAADHVVIPLSPDLFSLRDLESLGPTLARWREEWSARAPEPKPPELPAGDMRPIGYVMTQPSVRLDRPVQAYARWMDRIPGAYRALMLGEPSVGAPPMSADPHCIGMLKHYRSLMPMAQEARRPMFLLRPADGAIGAHQAAVREAWGDFARLAEVIAGRIGLALR